MRQLFGDKASFAIEYIGANNGLVEADLFVAGQNITPQDNEHYDQFLVHGAAGRTACWFLEIAKCWKDDLRFRKGQINSLFSDLWENGPWCDYSVFDWAPCTSSYRCAIIPRSDDLFLCCARHDAPDTIHIASIDPSRVAQDLLAAREHIVAHSSNPYLKLEVT